MKPVREGRYLALLAKLSVWYRHGGYRRPWHRQESSVITQRLVRQPSTGGRRLVAFGRVRRISCLAVCILFAVTGCGLPGIGTAPQSPPSTFVANLNLEDAISADVPNGWNVFRTNELSVDYCASPGGVGECTQPAIRATHLHRHSVERYAVPDEEDTYNLGELVLNWFVEKLADVPRSDFMVLPARTIDGNTARGYSYVLSSKDGPIRLEEWFVGRRDGVWELTLRSAPGETTLPPELDGILDTVTWTTPTPSPSASPT